MALQFQGAPDWLLQAYINRPDSLDKANESLNIISKSLDDTQRLKLLKEEKRTKALEAYTKLLGEVGPDQAPIIAQKANLLGGTNLSTNDFVPTDSSSTTPPVPNTPVLQTPATPTVAPTAGIDNLQSLLEEHPLANSPSVAQHIQETGLNPHNYTMPSQEQFDKWSKQGTWGKKQQDQALAGAKFGEALQTAQEKKDALKMPFEDVVTTFQAANEKSVGDKLIEDAKKAGLDHVPSKKVDYALKGLGVKNAGMRGGAFDSMAETRRLALKDSLIKEARTSLNPYFQSGAGKEQAQRLNAIGRAEALTTQMLNQPGGGDPRQMRELATSIDRVLRGAGTSAQTQIDELVPSTARGKFANWLEWFSNDPQGRDQQSFIKRYAETLSREKNQIQGQIKKVADSAAPTLRVLKETYPEDYQVVVDSVLKNPDMVGSGNISHVYSDPQKEAEYQKWKKDRLLGGAQ